MGGVFTHEEGQVKKLGIYFPVPKCVDLRRIPNKFWIYFSVPKSSLFLRSSVLKLLAIELLSELNWIEIIKLVCAFQLV